MSNEKAFVNDQINSSRVILIDEEGNLRGEFLKSDAIDMASSQGMDLVLVKTSNPPICKIMDYGKFAYNKKKKQKANTATIKTKEIKISPVTEKHDLDIRLNQARKFIKKGHRVKVTMAFKGRHIRHQELGEEKMNYIRESLQDIAILDSEPQNMGRSIQMVLIKK